MPGDDPREAVGWVVDALPELPHLPELPARGPWAALAGRGAALLVDLPVELELDRWQVASAPGRDLRRARSLLAQDLDALEEVLAGYRGPLKAQVCGPVTLAATVELRGGDVMSADPAALRDVAASLAEGVAAHLRDLARRVPGAELVLQVDEPALPAANAGTLPRPSGWGVHRALSTEDAAGALQAVLAAADVLGAGSVVHCCAAEPSWPVLSRSGARALSLDLEVLDLAHVGDLLGEWVDGGGLLWAGVATADPHAAHARLSGLQEVLGLDAEALARTIAVTPPCGLPDVGVEQARATYAATRGLARWLRGEEG